MDQFAKAKERAKTKKWGLIKFKSFCIAKETNDIKKRQTVEWGEKIFANNVTNKGLVSKICKQLILLDIRKTTRSENGQKI